MKRAVIVGLTLSLISGVIASLLPQPAEAFKFGVNKRQGRQEHRVNRGIANGSLTTKEATRLEKRQNTIAEKEAAMRASGGIYTPKERLKTQYALHKQSQQIYKQKHDGQNP